MPDITINTCGVSKQPSKLNPGKAAGLDGLTSRILKDLHIEVAPIFTDILTPHFAKVKYQMTGGMLLWPQSTKKTDQNLRQKITAPYL